MDLTRYNVVERVIKKLVIKILEFLNTDNINTKELFSLIEMREII